MTTFDELIAMNYHPDYAQRELSERAKISITVIYNNCLNALAQMNIEQIKCDSPERQLLEGIRALCDRYSIRKV